MRPCQHRGEEIGYLGCTCQDVEPAYHCRLLDIACAHKRPCKGNSVLTKLEGGTEWFTGHNPTCDKCQHYEPQRNNTDGAV